MSSQNHSGSNPTIDPLDIETWPAEKLRKELRDHMWWEGTAVILQRQRDELIKRMDKINVLACYASEENTDSRYAALLEIGRLAREELPK